MKCRNLVVVLLCFTLAGPIAADATQVDIQNPGPGNYFGGSVTALPNGNFVVTAEDDFVHLFDAKGQLISTLSNAPRDWGSITVLTDGNFVVCSPYWTPPPGIRNPANHLGAATWVDGAIGLNGEVSASNSLIGSQEYDHVCTKVVPLPGGKYVISSPGWSNASIAKVGAVTLCEGQGECTGVVAVANSLVGSSSSDGVGSAVVPLADGNFVVASPWWHRNGVQAVGAVTLCTLEGICTGQSISVANSLVGESEYDTVGQAGGDYLDGRYPGIIPLEVGDFVVVSSFWKNGAVANAGAATWVSGSKGTSGTVSATNSLVGSTAGDFFWPTVSLLVGGNYVVNNVMWDNGAHENAGASTWCNSSGGCRGAISPVNSLVGASSGDQVGSYSPPTALSNGSYIVSSPSADVDGRRDAGRVTWCDGAVGCSGLLSSANSMAGGSDFEYLGGIDVLALADGAYVVTSPFWDSAEMVDVGLSFRCESATGCTGVLSAANSLTGSASGDMVGAEFPPIRLANGNYVVQSNQWHGTGVTGALTWINGRKGLVGEVSETNSFVGVSTEGWVGGPWSFTLPNGDYVYTSRTWDNGAEENAGAITLLRGYGLQLGTIDQTNSVLGNIAHGGPQMNYAYSALTDTLIVGRPKENIVTLLRVDRLFFNGVD